ncbi:MAG TPA: lipoyl synthase [Chloroflexi bacterium]|nr:MAG: lipoyl synthase [Chloroflexota bacterium]HDD60973.1 lipoyl synthase [Chloroflexota bacterium]
MSSNPTRDRTNPQEGGAHKRLPPWLRVKFNNNRAYHDVNTLMEDQSIHTVCQEALCPNRGECWGAGTATFLLLGDVCTRACKFCDIKHGQPGPMDWKEPERIAQSIKAMDLEHAVVTSVNRDERRDGGAPIFAMLIRRIRQLQPGCSVEVLIPDFKGSLEALKIVMDAGPDILNHNLETIPQLFKTIQPQSSYQASRSTLVNAKRLNPSALTKSGLMVGLGESLDEIKETMRDIRSWEVDILTIGQYLQPSRNHLPVDRFYHPVEFEELKEYGLELGFKWVESAPLVRSSYHAAEQVRALRGAKRPTG